MDNKNRFDDNQINLTEEHSNASTTPNHVSTKNDSNIAVNKNRIHNVDDSSVSGTSNGNLSKFNEKKINSSQKKKLGEDNSNVEIENRYKGRVDVYASRPVGLPNKNNKKDKSNTNVSTLSKDNVVTNSTVTKDKDIAKKPDLSVVQAPVAVKQVYNKNNDEIHKPKDDVQKVKTEKKDISSKKNQNKYVGIIVRRDVSNLTEEQKEERLKELEKEILLGLDTKLEREIDNLERLESEHDEIVGELKYKKLISKEEIKEKSERLKEILKQIKFYIEQIEILNDNYRFEDIINLTEFKDQNIISSIVEYRDILESNNDRSKDLSDKYKMLDNFIILYREVYIKEELLKHNVDVSEEHYRKTEERDKKYDKLKDDVESVERVNNECKIIIDKQNEYLRALNDRISRIDSTRVLRYRMEGVNNILLSTLMYITIMNNMRFRNRRVQNAARLLVTGRMLRNLNRNRLRPVETIRYDAEDLQDDLYRHLNDLEILSTLVEVTLSDVRKMREEFIREFKGKVPGFEEVETKLDEVEKSILQTKKRLELSENVVNRNLQVNDRKMVRVRQLNERAA